MKILQNFRRASYVKGFSVIEIIVAIAIISSLTVISIASIQLYLRMSARNSTNMQIAMLFEETSEIIQFLRDKSWEENIGPLIPETEYELSWNQQENTYQIGEFNQNPENLSRTFRLSGVLRNADDQISDYGNPDLNTKLVTIRIYEVDEKGSVKNHETQMLIHNTYEN